MQSMKIVDSSFFSGYSMSAWQIAFETSGRLGSIALLREDMLVSHIVLDKEARTAQTLAPALQLLINRLEAERGGDPRKLDFVSVSVGPGSFTGLRIGVTAAKTLAFALDCPVVVCDTLAVIISQVRRNVTPPDDRPLAIDAAINAYRGQVFWRRESFSGNLLEPSQAIDLADWQLRLPQADSDTKIADNEITASMGRFNDHFLAAGDVWAKLPPPQPHISLADVSLWQPMAADVGAMGWQQFQRGEHLDCMEVVPKYLRESAAVEKRDAETKS
jgi:tRNA threonylcarbamoyladenosine biosynthesis protein TsaB